MFGPLTEPLEFVLPGNLYVFDNGQKGDLSIQSIEDTEHTIESTDDK